MYRRFLVVTTIVKRTDELGQVFFRPKVPCKITALTVVHEGVDITYDLKNYRGEEVVALIGCRKPAPQDMKDFEGRLPLRMPLLRNESAYQLHWPHRKRDRLVSADVKTHEEVYYTGHDKDERSKFKNWREED